MASSLTSNSLNIGSTTLTDSSLNIGNTTVASGSVTVGNSSLSDGSLNLNGVALTPGTAGTIATTAQIPATTAYNAMVTGSAQNTIDATDYLTLTSHTEKIIGLYYYWVTNTTSRIVNFGSGRYIGFYCSGVQSRGHGIGDSTQCPVYRTSIGTSFSRSLLTWEGGGVNQLGSGIFFRID